LLACFLLLHSIEEELGAFESAATSVDKDRLNEDRDALALADEIEDGQTGFLIERALDEARSRQFRLAG
jgi:hypothetical protein